jgi:hypothetical protein
MTDFSAGDVFFIILILGVIHGIMLLIGWLRRRKERSGNQ